MSKRGGLMTKVLFFVILFAGICWAEAGDAFEPLEGKATTGLNVRRYPGPGSQVITWLRKGQKVTIIDKKKQWYKIVFRGEGKRYAQGWVHSRYIQMIPSGKVEISSALAKVRAGIAVEELQEKIPLDTSEDEEHLPNGIEKELNKASTPATHVVKEQVRMAPQEGLLSGKKDVRDPLPEKANAVKEQVRAASRTKPSVTKEELSTSPAPATTLTVRDQTRATSRTKSPAPKMEVSTSPPPAITPVVSKRVDTLVPTIVPVVQKSSEQEPPASHDRKGLTDTQELKEVAKLALRLLSVVLSCLAILFSYKAIKLAKISYNTAMQLQRNLQVWQKRENGQLS